MLVLGIRRKLFSCIQVFRCIACYYIDEEETTVICASRCSRYWSVNLVNALHGSLTPQKGFLGCNAL